MVRFCTSKKSLGGKTALITGANTGLGYETALEFAKRGCHVILACRNEEKANEAKYRISNTTGNENIDVKIVDLQSMISVRKLAKNIVQSEDRLDILVNNAGAGWLPNETTADDLQLEMAINYFSHFLLTNLLLDLLKKSAPSRIINVSSSMAKLACNFKVEKLNDYEGKNDQYAKTKLCSIYFTQELAKRLTGSGVTTYSVHPGAVLTDFQRISTVLNAIGNVFFKTAEEGAQTQIYLSLEDGIEEYNGRHFEDCRPVDDYCTAKEPEKAKQLWEASEKLVGLKNFEIGHH